MSPKLTVRSAAGTRDYLPEEMALRNRVKAVIEESFQIFGFLPLETPSLERLEVLTGKYGKEADRLIFQILKRGDELKKGMETGELSDLGLRYDLTVPLSRVIAMNKGKLVFPFKRYQIQPVWRAERQQRGRYREFVQCDADIVGTSSVSADAEIIALTDDILRRLGIPGYKIYINNRKLLQVLIEYCEVPADKFLDVCVSIDKKDKIGWDGVKSELEEKGYQKGIIDNIAERLNLSGKPSVFLDNLWPDLEKSDAGQEAITEMIQLAEDLDAYGVPEDKLIYQASIARGLDYYTGPIYETTVEEPKIGSITGGGRYDNLIGLFSGESIPATGTSIGIERIFDVIRELHLMEDTDESPVKALVTVFSEETRTECPDEIYLNTVRLKNLRTGQQDQLSLENLIEILSRD
jgi:histidyl-tRNA synthetase